MGAPFVFLPRVLHVGDTEVEKRANRESRKDKEGEDSDDYIKRHFKKKKKASKLGLKYTYLCTSWQTMDPEKYISYKKIFFLSKSQRCRLRPVRLLVILLFDDETWLNLCTKEL